MAHNDPRALGWESLMRSAGQRASLRIVKFAETRRLRYTTMADGSLPKFAPGARAGEVAE